MQCISHKHPGTLILQTIAIEAVWYLAGGRKLFESLLTDCGFYSDSSGITGGQSASVFISISLELYLCAAKIEPLGDYLTWETSIGTQSKGVRDATGNVGKAREGLGRCFPGSPPLPAAFPLNII
uniref:Uncharacterized protein n=1 Tax=Molossus molossus TaxID=27622 RepID=A0A7J8GQB6_MOLMO|nr:hypothetical protein HJG59_011355 [Molossus molossus]